MIAPGLSHPGQIFSDSPHGEEPNVVHVCVAADAHNCVWSHVRAAGACPFRMLQWAVVAGSPSYGTGEAVCTVLRVC